MTAHYLAQDSYAIKAGDTVLVHSISRGVGQLLTQIAKLKGAKIYGTVSNPEKIAVGVAAGADRVLVRDREWVAAVLKLTGGQGVNVVFDGIGKTLLQSIAAVKPHGTAVYFGWAGGSPPLINPQVLMDDSKQLVGGELLGVTSLILRESADPHPRTFQTVRIEEEKTQSEYLQKICSC